MKTNTVTPTNKNLDQYMVNMVNKQLLKYAAGQHMFCKGCGNILDWKTTVVIEARKDNETATVVFCSKCFNPKGLEKLEDDGYIIEITKYEKS